MVAVAEAGWASLLLSAAYNGPHRPAVSLPFLAFALPAAAGVVVASWGSRLAGRWFGGPVRGGEPSPSSDRGADIGRRGATWLAAASSRRGRLRRWIRARRPIWWRAETLAPVPVLVIGMALAAGSISELSVPGSFGRVAVQPWSTVGHRPAVVAGAAWFVSMLAWVRGAWLGRVTLTARHVLWSLALAGAAFLGIFAGRAAHHSGSFGAATGAAGWLFFVSFPLMAAVIALVHQRDLERAVLARVSTRPGGAWVAVLVAPMAGVALVSLLLAVLVGPAAPALGRALRQAASAIWSAVASAARWLWDLLPRSHPRRLPPALGPKGGARHALSVHPPPPHATFTIPALVGEVLLALVVAAVAIYLLRHVRFPRLARHAAVEGTEERDSLFTWQHLFQQIRAALARLASRLRPRRRGRAARSPDSFDVPGVAAARDPKTVREVYRRLLIAAREAGAGRRTTETSRELANRFTSALPLAAEATEHLRHLTDAYEAVRYGSAMDADHHQASADAEAVIPALRVALAPEEPGRFDGASPGNA